MANGTTLNKNGRGVKITYLHKLDAKSDDISPPPFTSTTKLPTVEGTVIKKIDVREIDEYAFNPRRIKNNNFEEIKQSIKDIGLQQMFTVSINPKTNRYTITKGGNTRLKVFKELWNDTGNEDYLYIPCVVEEWDEETNKTKVVISHLIENEARGELFLVDKAKALLDLELEFRAKIDGKKSPQTLRTFDHKKTKLFLEYLKDNGYSVGETSLLIFRFTATKLAGNLDYYLEQGLGSPNIIKIRSVYNNAKKICVKNKKSEEDFEAKFKVALKKYNRKKEESFNFDTLLNIIASELYVLTAASIHSFTQQLTNPKKPNVNIIDAGDNDGQENTDIIAEDQDGTLAKTSIPNIDIITGITTDEIPVPTINNNDEEIDALRDVAFNFANRLCNKIGLPKCHKIDFATGFMIVDFPFDYELEDNSEYSDFDRWVLWYLLIAYSQLNNIETQDFSSQLEEFKESLFQNKQELHIELFNYYQANTIEAKNDLINKFIQASEFVAPFPDFVLFVKNRLEPGLWQELSNLESISYQIFRLTL